MNGSSLLIVAAAFALTSCGGDSSTSAVASDCTGTVAVTVSGGTSPTIDWTPRCKAFLIVVESTSSGHDVWSITSPGANGITPALSYGMTPGGAQTITAPVALTQGQSYTVAVRAFSAQSEDGSLVGTTTFVP